MARYRIGNAYLSEEEYNDHCEQSWKEKIFFISAVISALICFVATKDLDWPKYIRFPFILISAMGIGYLLAKISEIIRIVLFISIATGVAFLIGRFIWDYM